MSATEEFDEVLDRKIRSLAAEKEMVQVQIAERRKNMPDAIHNLVSVTLKEAADQFITIVKNTSAIEDKPGGPGVKQIEGVTLDAWARQVFTKANL